MTVINKVSAILIILIFVTFAGCKKDDDPNSPSGPQYLWVKTFRPSNSYYDSTFTTPYFLNGTEISFVVEYTGNYIHFERNLYETGSSIYEGNLILKYRIADGLWTKSGYENISFIPFINAHHDNNNVWGADNYYNPSEIYKTDYNGTDLGITYLNYNYFGRRNWVSPASSHEFINLGLNGEAEKINYEGQSLLLNPNSLTVLAAPNCYTLTKIIDIVKLNDSYYGQMSVVDSGSLAEVSHLFKIDNDLNHIWHAQVPVNRILTDGNSIVTVGNNNTLGTGGKVNKFNTDGTLLWTVSVDGSCRLDSTSEINTNGNIYIYITPVPPANNISIGGLNITGPNNVIVKFNSSGIYQSHFTLPFDCTAKIKSYGNYMAMVGIHRSTADFGIRELYGPGNFVALLVGF